MDSTTGHRAPDTLDASINRSLLSRSIAFVLVGIFVVVLDLRLDTFDVLLDPAGQLIVALGVIGMVQATGPSMWGTAASALAGIAVILSAVLELAVLNGEAAVGTMPGSEGGQLVGTLLITAQELGIICLAMQLYTRLEGIAADRWRQVAIGFGVSLLMTPVVILTEDLLLVLLSAAILITAGALLLLSLMATKKLATEPVDPIKAAWTDPV